MLSLKIPAGLIILVAVVAPCSAAETMTYSYDARGRLIKVQHTGTINNGVATTIVHDAAGNRRNVKTTGASK